MLVASLQGVDNAQDFSSVADSAGWVGKDGTDGLLGIDDEDAADSEGNTLLVDVGGVLVVDPESHQTQAFDEPQPPSILLTYHTATQSCAACRQ